MRDARLPAEALIIAFFDSYYLRPAVTDACAAACFPYIRIAKKNRDFAPDGRPREKRKHAYYSTGVLRHDGRNDSVRSKRHRAAQRVSWLSKAGRVKLPFSRRLETAWVSLVTKSTLWSRKERLEPFLVPLGY